MRYKQVFDNNISITEIIEQIAKQYTDIRVSFGNISDNIDKIKQQRIISAKDARKQLTDIESDIRILKSMLLDYQKRQKSKRIKRSYL